MRPHHKQNHQRAVSPVPQMKPVTPVKPAQPIIPQQVIIPQPAPAPMVPQHHHNAVREENHALRDENQRLLQTLKIRDQQIEELKSKQSPDVEQIETLRQQQAKHEAELLYEIESLRTQLQEKEQPLIKYTHQKELIESQSRIMYLSEQISQNERVLAMKDEEIKIMMGRITELEERKDIQSKLHEAEQRTHHILDKLERVTKRLHEKHDECEQLKKFLGAREGEISDWRVKSATTDQLGLQMRGLEQRVNLLAQENDRLTSILMQRNADIAFLKTSLTDRNEKWSQQEERIAQLQSELNLRVGDRSQQAEIESLRLALRTAESYKSNRVLFESNSEKVAILQEEINRLNRIVIEQRLELESLRTKSSDERWMAAKLQEQQFLGFSNIQSLDRKSVHYA